MLFNGIQLTYAQPTSLVKKKCWREYGFVSIYNADNNLPSQIFTFAFCSFYHS